MDILRVKPYHIIIAMHMCMLEAVMSSLRGLQSE